MILQSLKRNDSVVSERVNVPISTGGKKKTVLSASRIAVYSKRIQIDEFGVCCSAIGVVHLLGRRLQMIDELTGESEKCITGGGKTHHALANFIYSDFQRSRV
jgi:hypothetical protein